MNQEERSHQNSILLTLWSQTSQPLELWGINSVETWALKFLVVYVAEPGENTTKEGGREWQEMFAKGSNFSLQFWGISWRNKLAKAKEKLRNKLLEACTGSLQRRLLLLLPLERSFNWLLRSDGPADVLQHEESKIGLESNLELSLYVLSSSGHLKSLRCQRSLKGEAPDTFMTQALFPVSHTLKIMPGSSSHWNFGFVSETLTVLTPYESPKCLLHVGFLRILRKRLNCSVRLICRGRF